MTILLSLLCLAAVAVAVLLLYRRYREKKRAEQRRAEQRRPTDPFADRDVDVLRGDPRTLKAGDVLDTHGQSLTVRGTLRMREGGYEWAEHLIDTGGGVKRWLSVEEDPDLEMVLWTEVDQEAPEPGPRSLEFDGRSWRLDEAGRAQYVSEASTGLAADGTVHYYDYQAADGSYLSYEDFRGGGAYEVAIGLRIERHELTIYPQQPE